MKIFTHAKKYLRPNLLSLILICCFGFLGHAQVQFVHTFGDSESDKCTALATDAQGNIYMAGNFYGAVDFDPTSQLHQLYSLRKDQFLAKYDHTGKFLWAVNLGGNDYAEPAEIAVNSLGIYVLSSGDFFLTKLDLNGHLQWRKALRGDGTKEGTDLILDVAGNAFIVGEFSGTADFDLGSSEFKVTSKSASDFFVMKLDNYGDFEWVRTFGSNEAPNRALAVSIDQNQQIIVAGHFSGSLDFDPGLPEVIQQSNGYTDFFVLKLDAMGNYVWSKQLGTHSYDYEASDLAIDKEGNIYLTGDFHFTLDFDPGEGEYKLTAREDDVYLLKLSATGDFVWVRQIGGDASEAGHSIRISGERIYLAGTFQQTADFDPSAEYQNLSAQGINDGFLAELDARGNFVSARAMGGNESHVKISQIALGRDQALIVAGYFTASVNFGTGVSSSSAGFDDVFVASYTEISNTTQRISSPLVNDVHVYPNPSKGEFMIQAPSGKSFTALAVVNSLGAVVYTQKHEKGEANVPLDLRGFKTGLYFVQGFTETDGSFSTKIFID